MSLNTIPGGRFACHRAAELNLSESMTQRLSSDQFIQWRRSVNDINSFTIEELLLIYVLVPNEIMNIFPNLKTNIFALDHFRYLHAASTPTWRRMCSLLSITGFLVFIYPLNNELQRYHPTLLRPVALTMSMISSGFFSRQAFRQEILSAGLPRGIDVQFCSWARKAMNVTNQSFDPAILECIYFVADKICEKNYMLSQTTALHNTPKHHLYLLHPVEPSILQKLSIMSDFHDVNEDDVAFWCETNAGLSLADFRYCIPTGSKTIVTCRDSLFRTNIRSAIRMGFVVDFLEWDKLNFTDSRLSGKTEWLAFSRLYYANDHISDINSVTFDILYDFYSRVSREASRSLPEMLANLESEYDCTEDIDGKDALEFILPNFVPGSRVNPETVLWAVMKEVTENGASMILAKQTIKKLKKKLPSRIKRLEMPLEYQTAVFQQNNVLLCEWMECPKYVDESAWACAHVYGRKTEMHVDFFPEVDILTELLREAAKNTRDGIL